MRCLATEQNITNKNIVPIRIKEKGPLVPVNKNVNRKITIRFDFL